MNLLESKFMNSISNKRYKSLSIFFWLNILILIISFILIYLYKDPNQRISIDQSVIFERYAIIITLASIPLTLKVFHSYISKAKSLSFDVYKKKYLFLYILRIVIFDLVAIMNIIGYYFCVANNFLYLTVVAMFAIAFCYPSKDVIINSEND